MFGTVIVAARGVLLPVCKMETSYPTEVPIDKIRRKKRKTLNK